MTVIEGVNVSLNIINDYSRCARVFKFLVYLGTGARTAVLLGALRVRDLSLLKKPSCLRAAAIYKVFIKFLFRSSRCFKGG